MDSRATASIIVAKVNSVMLIVLLLLQPKLMLLILILIFTTVVANIANGYSTNADFSPIHANSSTATCTIATLHY